MSHKVFFASSVGVSCTCEVVTNIISLPSNLWFFIPVAKVEVPEASSVTLVTDVAKAAQAEVEVTEVDIADGASPRRGRSKKSDTEVVAGFIKK